MAQSTGYHQLAELMGPYQEAAIFRRFGPLAMMNLLSLQAELVELHAEFRKICQDNDHSADPVEKNFSKYFRDLRESEGGGKDHQYQMLMQIRSKLNEYCTHMLVKKAINTGLTISLNRFSTTSSSTGIETRKAREGRSQ